jgi:hypothetical protein
MTSNGFAQPMSRLLLGTISLSAVLACTSRNPVLVLKKTPAEITLPPASATAFEDIEVALSRFEWGPGHDATCQGCPTPGVIIRSIGSTKDIQASNGPAKFRVVALIQNFSNQAVTHTPSGTIFKAKTRYLMWVHSRGDKKAIWGFVELGPDYDPKPKAIGLLIDCGHPTPSPTDDADFYACEDVHRSAGASGWTKVAYASTLASASISKPGWVACDPDCCTGTNQQ